MTLLVHTSLTWQLLPSTPGYTLTIQVSIQKFLGLHFISFYKPKGAYASTWLQLFLLPHSLGSSSFLHTYPKGGQETPSSSNSRVLCFGFLTKSQGPHFDPAYLQRGLLLYTWLPSTMLLPPGQKSGTILCPLQPSTPSGTTVRVL